MQHLDEVTSVLLGESKAAKVLRDQVVKAAAAATPVLIYGPPGSGKEVTARAIHAASRRRGPFIPVNVNRASEFVSRNTAWHEAWGVSATFGTYPVMPGDRNDCGGGTAFLKDLCELHPVGQTVLLNALNGGLFQPTDDSHNVAGWSFRLISATNVSPKQLLKDKHFRESLLRQLGSVTITVPSLVQRYKDIPVLAMHFLTLLPEAERPLGCTAAAMRRLQEYHWPGNVRELQRVITAAATLAPGAMLDDMAIAFALNTVDRERKVDLGPADSPPRDEAPGSYALRASGHTRGAAVPNHLAKRSISYGLRLPELLRHGTRAKED
jgi:DNA-binding NtrC family response regulator